MALARFSLVKWYMDCVTEEGDTAILYCADLRWRGVHASYASALAAAGETITTQSSMARYCLSSTEDEIRVELPTLGISGRWQATAAPVCHTLYESDSGAVKWNCLQPASSAKVRVGDRELCGAGYAECLTLTLPPWQLPMRQLRWGRFVSPQDRLVWIDWQGAYCLSLAVHNGRNVSPVSISDTEVVLADATLRLSESFPLRAGRLGATVFPGAHALGKLLPEALRTIEEKKWRSSGAMKPCGSTSARESHGWAIHEVVLWNC